MSNSSDPMFDHSAEMDFTDAKLVTRVPALAKQQAEHGGKSRSTMHVENTTLAIFKARAEMSGGNCILAEARWRLNWKSSLMRWCTAAGCERQHRRAPIRSA